MLTTTELRREVLDTVENNILRFWLDNMVDYDYGGYYGQMTGTGTLVPTANKGCILNARILWTFSAAYRVLHKAEYLVAATRARDYIIDHFIDKDYGGAYWAVDYQGTPIDTKKQFYALGFVLYGMSEYARATGDSTALTTAIDLFHTIEQHAKDPIHNGYIEAMSRDWQPLSDMRLSELDENFPKSQNTHLHIIEPYANLYRCLTEQQHSGDIVLEVAAALRNLINIFCDKILNGETHHLDLFFHMDWTRAAGQLESYGHDIECSWLLHEAALVLHDATLLATVEPIVKLVAQASEKGLNSDGSMTHEANVTTGYVDRHRHWWVQAEAIVGFYNLYQHFDDTRAYAIALRLWDYVKDNIIDYDRGEWYWSCDEHGQRNTTDDHAGFWKCPYHNSRMCLELIERINA